MFPNEFGDLLQFGPCVSGWVVCFRVEKGTGAVRVGHVVPLVELFVVHLDVVRISAVVAVSLLVVRFFWVLAEYGVLVKGRQSGEGVLAVYRIGALIGSGCDESGGFVGYWCPVGPVIVWVAVVVCCIGGVLFSVVVRGCFVGGSGPFPWWGCCRSW